MMLIIKIPVLKLDFKLTAEFCLHVSHPIIVMVG